MHDESFLEPILVLLLIGAFAVPLFMRLGLGAVLAYLVAGVLVGPAGIGLIPESTVTAALSELGIVLLLFLIGLELSPARVWLMRRAVFGIGLLQVLVTAAVIAPLSLLLQPDWRLAVVVGLGLALSSTAIGLQVLAERRELNHAHGRLGFAILLFQDIATLPILALLPLLALHGVPSAEPTGQAALRIVLVIAAVVVFGRYLIRPLFRQIAQSHSTEAFAAMALLVVFGTAWLMTQAGLSPALGAFLAGVLLAESEFRHEVESHIQPFKGLLLGLFFVSVGMAIDLHLVLRETVLVAGLALALIAVKLSLLWLIARWPGGLDRRDSLRLAALLCQGGEFGFVIFAVAAEHALLDPATRSLLVVLVALSMVLTPLLVAGVDRLLARGAAVAAPPRDFDVITDEHPRVVIAGFGRVGQVVARVLRAQKIPFVALEHSPEQVELSRRFGSRLYYGDPSRPDLLRACGIAHAQVFVAATDDPDQVLRMVRLVRRQYPQVRVVARARNRQHAFRLMDLGVEVVVRETFHGSLELARHALSAIGLADAVVDDRIARFRAHDENLLREQHLVYDDEAALLQSSREARQDLEKLFEADR